MLFVAFGDWADRDPRRGKGAGILRAQEAFGPIQELDEAVYPGKPLGVEYLDRYYAEQDEVKSLGFACPALSPATMLERCIPAWVKESYFTA